MEKVNVKVGDRYIYYFNKDNPFKETSHETIEILEISGKYCKIRIESSDIKVIETGSMELEKLSIYTKLSKEADSKIVKEKKELNNGFSWFKKIFK